MFKQFSFRRLGLLIRTHWLENSRLYLLGTFSMTGIMAIALILQLTTRSHYSPLYTHDLFPIYMVGLWTGGAIFGSISCSHLSDKAKGIYWLTLPASHLEKLITITVYTLVVFPLVYTFCFLAVKEVTLSFFPKQLLIRDGSPLDNTNMLEDTKAVLFVFMAIQSFFLLGGIYFKRFSFIKTAIAGAICVLFFLLMVNNIGKSIFHHNLHIPAINWDGFQASQNMNGGALRLYHYPSWFSTIFLAVAKTIWAPVFLVAAWFRLKEKEI